MPHRPPSPCGTPGCAELVHGGGRCEKHRRVTQRDYDRARAKTAARAYSSAWRRLRRLVLDAEPLCRSCDTAGHIEMATQVDHIIPLARGGTNAMMNLQPLCATCHARKTAQDDRRWG